MQINKLFFAMLLLTFGGHVSAASSCLVMADQRGLTGAARGVFLEQCETQARAACESNAKKQKLSGPEKDSFLKKCKDESVGVK
jgi:hypothetical protein